MLDRISDSSLDNIKFDSDFESSQNTSIQLEFAKLQMSLAKSNRDKAESIIKEIKASQDLATQYANTLNMFRTLKSEGSFKLGEIPSSKESLENEITLCQNTLNAINKTIDSSSNSFCVALPQDAYNYVLDIYKQENSEDFVDMFRTGGSNNNGKKEATPDNLHYKYELEGGAKAFEQRLELLNAALFCMDNGIDISSFTDGGFPSDELETIIANLKSKQDTIGTDIQQKMVYVQDYIGQYNSYSSGASTAISEANDLLKSVATGR